MSRKPTLKQKLKRQLREQAKLAKLQHELAGITINSESIRINAASVAHGLMAGLLSAKKNLDVASDGYKAIEVEAQQGISRCMATLLSLGIPAEEANQMILRGC